MVRIVKPDATKITFETSGGRYFQCKESDTIEIDIDEMIAEWSGTVGRFKQSFSEYLQEKIK